MKSFDNFYIPSAVGVIANCPFSKRYNVASDVVHTDTEDKEPAVNWSDDVSVGTWKHYQAKKLLSGLVRSFNTELSDYANDAYDSAINRESYARDNYDASAVSACDNIIRANRPYADNILVGNYVRYVFDEVCALLSDNYADKGWNSLGIYDDHDNYMLMLSESPVDLRFAGFGIGVVDTAIISYGTDDRIYNTCQDLIVIDYKTGYRNVQAKENLQLVLYAIGICEKYNILPLNIKLVIFSDKSCEWRTDYSGILKVYKEKIIPALHSDAKHAGDWCSFCPCCDTCIFKMHETCRKMEELLQKQMAAGKDNITNLTDNDLADICTAREHIHTVTDSARKSMIGRIENNGQCAGYTEITSRSIKAGCDDAIIEKLRSAMLLKGSAEKLYTARRLSITAIDKLTGGPEQTKNLLGSMLYDKPSGKVKKISK